MCLFVYLFIFQTVLLSIPFPPCSTGKIVISLIVFITVGLVPFTKYNQRLPVKFSKRNYYFTLI